MRKERRPSKSRSSTQQPKGQPVSPSRNTWRGHAWRITALWILTFAAYSNSFQAGFVFDNRTLILGDNRVHAATRPNVDRILTGDYWPDQSRAGLFRPVTTISYLVNYAIMGNGSNPEGYHWVNLLLHGINVALVYAIGLVILGAPTPALALAGIWAVQPLLTESVTNIVGRADLLAGLGVLAGLLCYFKGQSADGSHRFAWVAGMAAAQALGLFSKENAIVLIGLMVLSDLTLPHDTRRAKRIPFYAASGLVCAVYVLIRAHSHSHMDVGFSDNPLTGVGFWAARLTAIKVLGKYVFLFLWPISLSADYSFNAIRTFSGTVTEWEDAKTLLVTLAFAATLFWVIRYHRKSPMVFFLGFFFVAMLPTSNLVILIGSPMAERFAYLPFIGLAGCLVSGSETLLFYLRRKWNIAPQVAWAGAVLLCAAFATRTYARNSDWLDDASLWTRTVEVYPQNAKAHLNLGRVFLEVPGRLRDAISEYEYALRIDPGNALAHYSLAVALSNDPGRLNDTIDHYRAALRSEPNYPQAHNNLGVALAKRPERLLEAESEFRAALRLEPSYAEAHTNLGEALAFMPGRLSEAIAEYNAALKIAPDLAMAHYDLGGALAETPGRLEDAIVEFRLAIKANPNFAPAYNNLGICLARMPGHLPDAILEFESAIHHNPGFAEAHLNLGRAYLQTSGRHRDAIQEFETAQRLQPDPSVAQLLDQLRADRQ